MQFRALFLFVLFLSCGPSKKHEQTIDQLKGQLMDLEKNVNRMNLKIEDVSTQIRLVSDELEENRILLRSYKKNKDFQKEESQDSGNDKSDTECKNNKETKTMKNQSQAKPSKNLPKTGQIKDGNDTYEAVEYKSGEEYYEKASQAYQEKNFDRAIILFDTMIKKFPRHKLLENAFYWLGECYYDKNEYLLALSQFQLVVSKFPGKTKAPDALLKVALSYSELGSKENTQKNLNTLISDYPESAAAQKARELLQKFNN